MAAFGLILGGGFWLMTRPNSGRPKDAYDRGKYRVARASAVPLMIIGVVGLVLWALGH
jgi:hypothetical protein